MQYNDISVNTVADMMAWDEEDIAAWLGWISSKFCLDPRPDAAKFPSRGVDLASLSKEQLAELAGSKRAGTVLACHLAHVAGKPVPQLTDIGELIICLIVLKFYHEISPFTILLMIVW